MPATGDGILGIYDAAAGYARVGEVPSGGLDPHEIGLLPDGETLVVANGGIVTDPDWPGIKLNLGEMDSSLAYLRARDGALLATARLPGELFQLSLRHLAIAPDGAVAVVMQYEGPSDDLVPLLALQRRPAGPLEVVSGSSDTPLRHAQPDASRGPDPDRSRACAIDLSTGCRPACDGTGWRL